MNSLCIISCGKRKIWDNNPSNTSIKAKYLYTGVFTKKCIEYAEKMYNNSYCIMSAKYGFIFPEEYIKGPYNECFHIKNSNPISKEALSQQIKDKKLNNYDKVIILGGKFYTDMINELFPKKEVINLLDGCNGIGQMMKRLNELVSKN